MKGIWLTSYINVSYLHKDQNATKQLYYFPQRICSINLKYSWSSQIKIRNLATMLWIGECKPSNCLQERFFRLLLLQYIYHPCNTSPPECWKYSPNYNTQPSKSVLLSMPDTGQLKFREGIQKWETWKFLAYHKIFSVIQVIFLNCKTFIKIFVIHAWDIMKLSIQYVKCQTNILNGWKEGISRLPL